MKLLKNIGFLFLFAFVFFFTSCQKELDVTQPNQPQNDSTDLSAVIVLDTTLVPGRDTLFKVAFVYDSRKRLTGEDFTEIDNSTGIRYFYYYKYSYSGNDTLPFKVSEKYSFSADSQISHLTYNNGFIIRDSSVDFTSGTVINIRTKVFSSLAANRFLVKDIDYDPVTGFSQVYDSTIYSRTTSAGNLISGLDSIWFAPGLPSLLQINRFQYTYDNKNNPFRKFSLWYLGYFDNFDNQIYIDKGINNLLSTRYETLFPPGPPDVNQYTYSYNSNNYPVILRTSGTDGNKALYFYTKL